MRDVTNSQTLPMDDVMFGRNYAVRGETAPEFQVPHGWWIVPAVLGGAVGWIALISAAFF